MPCSVSALLALIAFSAKRSPNATTSIVQPDDLLAEIALKSAPVPRPPQPMTASLRTGARETCANAPLAPRSTGDAAAAETNARREISIRCSSAECGHLSVASITSLHRSRGSQRSLRLNTTMCSLGIADRSHSIRRACMAQTLRTQDHSSRRDTNLPRRRLSLHQY